MDERHGVDHLDGAGHRGGGGLVAANQLARGESQHGAHALAASEERVTHGLVKALGLSERQSAVERFVHGHGLGRHVQFEAERILLL